MEAPTPEEARVLGSLLEKEAATPEYYPLTLNALRNACNQTSSRQPVVSYDDGTIEAALASLREKKLVRIVYSPSNRASKYRHVLEEVVPVEREGLAMLCLLLLRGPQTVGELRSRSERLAPFESTADVEAALERLERTRLEGHEDPLARRLPRQPGQKETRYAQLLTGEPDEADWNPPVPAPAGAPGPGSGALAGRVAALEEEVAALRRDVAELRELFS
jgi:uncharacterized protein